MVRPILYNYCIPLPPPHTHTDQMSVSIGIAVGFSILGLLLLTCLIHHLWGKIKCKTPKCCKRKSE